MANESSQMIEMFALWKQESKKGVVYYSGKMNGASVILWPNDKKGNEKAPDFRCYLAPAKKREHAQKSEPVSDIGF